MILYIHNARWDDTSHNGITAQILTDTYNCLCEYHFVSTDPEFQEIVNSGFNIEEPEQPTVEEIIQEIKDRIQLLLDDTARQKNYDNGVSLASYANSTIDSFKQEALSFIQWRDTVWNTCYHYLDLYQKGEYEFTTVSDFLSLLPTFNWENNSEVSE